MGLFMFFATTRSRVGKSVAVSGTAEVSIAWDYPTTNDDASPIHDLKGFKIYYGTSTGVYTNSIDLTTVSGKEAYTEYTIPDLVDGTTYYIAVTTIDSDDNESAKSSEVSAVASVPNPIEPTWTDIAAADLPYTISSTGNYRLIESATQNSGAAITVSNGVTGVVIYGGNRSWGDGEAGINLTYAETGAGQAINVGTGTTNLEIYGFNIIRGAATLSTSADGTAILGSSFGTGLRVHDCDFDLNKGVSWGVYTTGSMSNIRVYNNTVTLRDGQNAMGFMKGSSASIAARHRAYDNTISLENLDVSAYNGAFHFTDFGEYYNNTVTADALCDHVFVFQGWGNGDHYIHNNTITWNCVNSRCINMDGGGANNFVLWNTFNMNDPSGSGGQSRAMLQRYTGNNNRIGFNTVVGLNNAFNNGFTIGSCHQLGGPYDIYLYHNSVTTGNVCLELGDCPTVGDAGSGVYSWNNTYTALGSGNAIFQTIPYPITGFESNNDTVTGNIYVQNDSEPDWRVFNSFELADITFGAGASGDNMTFPGTATFPVSNVPAAPTGVAVI